MPNLETSYMGLTLKNPILVASSGLTKTVEKIVSCEKAGAGGVVLKSLFEEALAADDWKMGEHESAHPEMLDYLRSELRFQYGIDDYCDLVHTAKKEVSIPVIASINCISDKWLVKFARRIESAGADGLELNVFAPLTKQFKKAVDVENQYLEMLEKAKASISIPVAMKIGMYFTSLPEFVNQLEYRKLDALVMFNRFTEPDIDIDKLDLYTTFTFSSKEEINRLLRWVAIISGVSRVDVSATTGIHTYEGVIKLLLAGASTVQLASVLYKNDFGKIGEILNGIHSWMQTHNFEDLQQFRGSLNFSEAENTELYLRTEFMEKVRGIE